MRAVFRVPGPCFAFFQHDTSQTCQSGAKHLLGDGVVKSHFASSNSSSFSDLTAKVREMLHVRNAMGHVSSVARIVGVFWQSVLPDG